MNDYFIGLDIGTDSVGWAVTDEQYQLLKANQKALWGIRLFDEASTAVERRGYRTARRRLERRNQRLHWLSMLFDEPITSVDPGFYLRLKESKFLEEDKDSSLKTKFSLFSDEHFTDKDYYKKYPTIYHLRKALLTEDGIFDVRLVYLAIHHILKHRGHFLFDTSVSGDITSFETSFAELNNYLREEYDTEISLPDSAAFSETLKDRRLRVNNKKKLLKDAAGVGKTEPMLSAVIDMLAGGSVKLAELYQDETLKDAELKSFSLTADFDAKEPELEALLNDRLDLIRKIKAVYDWAILDDIMAGQQYLSCAKVLSYEKHQRDLRSLKAVVKPLGKEKYREVFHTCQKNLDNYSAYSGKTTENYHCNYESFSKYIKTVLDGIQVENPELNSMRDELDAGIFLPLQSAKSNSVIPNQVHRKELEVILQRASAYLPFLSEKDTDGMTVSDKILSIFDFRVPYYVGPLNTASKFAWVKRENGKIYPWNFRNMVDMEASAENFIRRMTSLCSYIGEPVLPKDSLLYSEFTMLNELNNLCINGKRISAELKNSIVQELFMKQKKVTAKRLQNYLLSVGACQKEDVVSGIDGDFKASLSSYHAFHRILEAGGSEGMVEDIICHIVLFGDDRKLLKNWLIKTYGKQLNEPDIDYITKLKFTGWGRLSREFLTEIYHADPQTGEAISIIEMMRQSNCNLMECLSSHYTFRDAVEAYKEQNGSMVVHSAKQYVEDSYASPSVKRAILQSITIVDELVKIKRHQPPKRIFVEMARGPEEKKRTESRKNKLLPLYEKCREDADGLYELLESKTDSDLRRDKLFLYFTQMGKCMYSGRRIDIERLDTDYDIDHIYPQSKVKDDSLDNRVLVERTLNGEKSDTYPIAQEIRNARTPFWTMLKQRGFISEKKFERLTRSTKFTEDELAGFIARQLVETRQSSKIVAEILKKRYGDKTEIVYVKAGNVSRFRQESDEHKNGEKTYDFVKCREVNDYHHAKDAYLNIVVGNVYHVKFTADPRRFLRSDEARNYSMNRVFDYIVKRGNETAWLPGKEGTMAVVRSTMRKNNILFTRMAHEVGGGLFDQQIVPKGRGQAFVKSEDSRMSIEKFGGYNKLTGAYFCLVEHTEKKKRVRSMETVLLMYKGLYENNPNRYCTEILGLVDPIVLIRRIKINAMVDFDGFRMHISGRTGSQIIYKNANQLVVASENSNYIKQICKYCERRKEIGVELRLTSFDGISREKNAALFDVLTHKLEDTVYNKRYDTAAKRLREVQERFLALDAEEQCLVLAQILHLFTSDATNMDLKMVGGKAGIGILLLSKNIENYMGHTYLLINQSITGVFEQKVDLLTVQP